MGLHRPITIGRIDYANVWPIFHYAKQMLPDSRYIIDKRVPSALNGAIQRGEVDITAMSSFAYAQHADDYLLLPDLSVSAKGRVNSILLFMREPIERVLKGRIALTATSATSVHLLQIIMSLYYGASPSYVTMEPDLDSMLQHADAALLIGDPAIQASWQERGLTVLDLGELWSKWTGCGMTFALLAVRKATAAERPEEVAAVLHALTESKRRSLLNPQPLIDQACGQLGGERAYWSRYFQELSYDFGAEEQAGLQLYFNYAQQLRLLPHEVRMQFFIDDTAIRVNE